jgi:hypothetical protein
LTQVVPPNYSLWLMPLLSRYLIILLLVAFHGLGLCHVRVATDELGGSLVGTSCDSDQAAFQDCTNMPSTGSCSDHGLPTAKSLTAIAFGLDLPVLIEDSLHPSDGRALPLPVLDSATRFASRSLPLLI